VLSYCHMREGRHFFFFAFFYSSDRLGDVTRDKPRRTGRFPVIGDMTPI
jgi:hypothetical protein